MWLDAGFVLVILLYGALGFFQGIIAQIFRLIGLVVIFFYIAYVTEPVGQWLAVHLNLQVLTAYYIAFIGGALIIYAACALAGRGLHKMVSKGEKPQTLDRVLGCILGVVKGAVVAFLLVCMLDMIPAAKFANSPWLGAQMKDSAVVARVHPWNPLPQLRFLADVEDYKKVAEDPEALQLLQQQPAYAKLRVNPKFRVAESDPELKRLIQEKRWPEVMVNSKVVALVYDREVRGILNELRPRVALDEAALLKKRSSK